MGYSKLVNKKDEHTKTKKYIYEVKWMHKPIECNSWVERDILLAMGYSKIVMKKDEQEAAAAGLLSKPLTQQGVEKALKDFGLDSEAASHSPISSLSHGQKVKVVICAGRIPTSSFSTSLPIIWIVTALAPLFVVLK